MRISIDSGKLTSAGNHFNRSLPTSRTVCLVAASKWRHRVNPNMSNPAFYHSTYRPRVISRQQILRVHDFALMNCGLRDYLLIRLPMKAGLRTNEICMLRIEDIDFESCRFRVLDSKKHRYFPLPLDIKTVEYIRKLVGPVKSGYVFRQRNSWRFKKQAYPLRKESVCVRVRQIGLAAGVVGLKPRLLRDFFAAYWFYVKKGNLEILRQIMRHESIDMTSQYVRSMVFEEDVEDEYRRIMDDTACSVTKKELME